MNQPVRRGLTVFSPQGLVTLSFVMLVALCAADQFLNARDYIRLSWLVVEAFSFPLGWLADWLARAVASAFPDPLKLLVWFVISATGTVLNIHLFVSATFWYFRNRNVQRPPEEREAEFQKLLTEHRKRSS